MSHDLKAALQPGPTEPDSVSKKNKTNNLRLERCIDINQMKEGLEQQHSRQKGQHVQRPWGWKKQGICEEQKTGTLEDRGQGTGAQDEGTGIIRGPGGTLGIWTLH